MVVRSQFVEFFSKLITVKPIDSDIKPAQPSAEDNSSSCDEPYSIKLINNFIIYKFICIV
jgi:hypothetical protein